MHGLDEMNTSTPDGILRRREVDQAFLGHDAWDARGAYPYIPPASPDLKISPRLQLHTDFETPGLGRHITPRGNAR